MSDKDDAIRNAVRGKLSAAIEAQMNGEPLPGQVTHYGQFREQVPGSPMIKEAEFFKSQGGLTEPWGKHWEPIYDAKTCGDARRKIAAKYGATLSFLYLGEK